MQHNPIRNIAAFASVAFAGAAATAGVADNAVHGPLYSPFDAIAEVRFVSKAASWTGELSLLSGAATNSGPLFLMANNVGDTSHTVSMGSFAAGEELAFEYANVRGNSNVYRTTDAAGALQFKHEWIDADLARLYIEDIKLPGGDHDYNDAVFEISFTPSVVPAPATAALAAVGLGFTCLRRRSS